MKRLLYALYVLLFSLVVSCAPREDDGKEVPSQVPADIILSVSSEVMEEATGGSFDLVVMAPVRPSVTTPSTWLSIPDGTYNANTYKITYKVTVSANEGTSERSTTVTVSAGALSKTFTVVQAGTPEAEEDKPIELSLDKHFLSLKQGGGMASVIVTAPEKASLSGVPSWLGVTETDFKNYKMKFTFKADMNDSFEELSTMVKVTAGSLQDQITIVQAAKEKEPEPGDSDAWKLAYSLGLGWNMGNHFDAFYNGSWAGALEGYPSETVWGGIPATQATFNGVKSLGFSSVRIPVSWLKMIGPAPDYKIDQTWMNRIYEVVEFAHNAGLKVIINTHHDENHGEDNTYQWLDIKNAAKDNARNEAIKKEIVAVWTQIANKFNNCGDWLIMESFNEINDGGWGWSEDFRANPAKQCNILNEWNQVFVNAVRATGGNNATRWLGVPTYAANPEFEKYFTMPTDAAGKVALAVHFYDPTDYTIGEKQYSDWGHTGTPGLKANYGDEDYVKAVFGNLFNKYVNKDTPVYIGEFGCSVRAQSNARAWAFYLYYLEYIVKAARTYGLPCFLWDNGATGSGQEQHGYINHGTGETIGNSSIPIGVMVNAWNKDSDNYTLQSVFDSAPRF